MARSNSSNDLPIDYQRLLDALSDGLALLDADGTVQYFNQSLAAMVESLGAVEPPLAIGIRYVDALAGWLNLASADHSALATQIQAVLAGAVDLVTREHLPTKSHADPPPRWSLDVRPCALGAAPGALISHRDTSIAFQQLAESDLRYAQIFNLNRSVKLLMDPATGSIVDANPSACQFYGYSRDELITKNITDLNRLSWEESTAIMRAAAQEQRSYVTFRHYKASGEPCEIEVYPGPIRLNGRTLVCSVIHDITDLRVREEALRQWEHIFQHVTWGMAVIEPEDWVLEAFNPALADLLRCTNDDLLGRSLVNMVAPPERAAAIDALQHALDDGESVYECTALRGDGSQFPALLHLTAVYHDDDSIDYLTASLQDITAQKQAQAHQEQLQAEIIRMQEETLAELSTPLIPLTDDIVVIPLIGNVDSRRAEQVLATLLEGISAHRARLAILDITGVPVVDTHVANGLVSAAQAGRLLGAEVILTGLRPEIAQTLVGMGVSLEGIRTLSSLQASIAYAIRQRML